MRATASFVLLAPLLLFACSDDQGPLDGLTAAPDTSPATSPGSAGVSTGDPATSTGDDLPGTTGTASPTTGGPTTGGPGGPGTTTGDPDDPFDQARQLCVDIINMYRGTLGLAPYQRWTDAEGCSDAEAAADGASGEPHGAFGMCGESAQNECPGWPSPAESSLPGCLEQMWAEGPGEDFLKHGHYLNMSSEQYSEVACGFADAGGGDMWMVQNFR